MKRSSSGLITVALGECLRKVGYQDENRQASTAARVSGGKPADEVLVLSCSSSELLGRDMTSKAERAKGKPARRDSLRSPQACFVAHRPLSRSRGFEALLKVSSDILCSLKLRTSDIQSRFSPRRERFSPLGRILALLTLATTLFRALRPAAIQQDEIRVCRIIGQWRRRG